MKKVLKRLKRILSPYIPVPPPKPLTKSEREKREQEIINKINQRIAMRDDC